MRVYIAGPMTGLPEFNYPAFREAAEKLRQCGYDVLDPSRREVQDGWEWSDYLRPALVDVAAADGVALLPGHQNSRGARLEADVADRLGMPVMPLYEWLAAEHLPGQPSRPATAPAPQALRDVVYANHWCEPSTSPFNTTGRDVCVTCRDGEEPADWPCPTFAAAQAPAPTSSIDAAHLARQREWSERTFGPGRRTAGVCDHIRKELKEVEADPGDVREWVDVAILALDGAWRTGAEPQEIIDAIRAKQARNEARTWPDWRTMSEEKAIEHVRDGDA